MPSVRALTDEGRILQQKEKVTRECKILMLDNNITKTKIASILGITPQAVSSQFKSNSVSLETVLAVIYITHAKSDEIAKMMTIN